MEEVAIYTLRFQIIDGTYIEIHAPLPFLISEITKEEYEGNGKLVKNNSICTIE